MNADDFKLRTKQFALRTIRLVHSMPRTPVGQTIGRQLLRAGTSVGANYRAACRARSPAEFQAKMGIVEEECDETLYWMELVVESELMPGQRLSAIRKEADEILSLVVASIRTSRSRHTKRSSAARVREP